MSRELNFDLVMARLKQATNASSYAELGRWMGLSTSAYANRKRANSIPFPEVIDLASSRSISIEWLLFGEGDTSRSERDQQKIIQEVDGKLLTGIVMALQRALWRGPGEMPHAKLIAVGQEAGLAAVIYNKVANIENERIRDVAIKTEAEAIANVVQIMETKGV